MTAQTRDSPACARLRCVGSARAALRAHLGFGRQPAHAGWWSDAKFGIFIHWGVYSVPAFAPKGEYAEWYWERLRKPGNPDASTERCEDPARDARVSRTCLRQELRLPGLRAAVHGGVVRRRSVGGHLRALGREVRGAGVEAPRRLCAVAFARSERELGPPVECGRRRAAGATSSASSPPPCGAVTSKWVSISRCTSGSTRAGLPGTWMLTSKATCFRSSRTSSRVTRRRSFSPMANGSCLRRNGARPNCWPGCSTTARSRSTWWSTIAGAARSATGTAATTPPNTARACRVRATPGRRIAAWAIPTASTATRTWPTTPADRGCC